MNPVSGNHQLDPEADRQLQVDSVHPSPTAEVDEGASGIETGGSRRAMPPSRKD